jgi:hypothetical protein
VLVPLLDDVRKLVCQDGPPGFGVRGEPPASEEDIVLDRPGESSQLVSHSSRLSIGVHPDTREVVTETVFEERPDASLERIAD